MTVADAYIIDAVRTYRGVGKMGKGAISTVHPEHLSAQVLAAIRDRNNLNTAEVDDVIWGVSGAMGLQAGDIGRNAALDAGYDVKAGGVTLNRFCGSSITATNFAASMVMSGMHDLVISGGMDMMSYVNYYGMKMHEAGMGGGGMGTNNPRLQEKHPQSNQGVCADAIAAMEGISREELEELGLESQRRAAVAIAEGRFDKSTIAVTDDDGNVLLDHEEYPRPDTTKEGLAQLKPAFEMFLDMPSAKGQKTYRELINQKYPDVDIKPIHHVGISSGVVDGAAAVLIASKDYADKHGLKPRARIVAMACREEGAGKGRPHQGRHRRLGSQRGLRRGRRKVHPRPRSRPLQGEPQRWFDRAWPPDRGNRRDPHRHRSRRAGTHRRPLWSCHHVRGRRHGAGNHHREDLKRSEQLTGFSRPRP
jgi:acetyl-CoA C-acetyltransferase